MHKFETFQLKLKVRQGNLLPVSMFPREVSLFPRQSFQIFTTGVCYLCVFKIKQRVVSRSYRSFSNRITHKGSWNYAISSTRHTYCWIIHLRAPRIRNKMNPKGGVFEFMYVKCNMWEIEAAITQNLFEIHRACSVSSVLRVPPCYDRRSGSLYSGSLVGPFGLKGTGSVCLLKRRKMCWPVPLRIQWEPFGIRIRWYLKTVHQSQRTGIDRFSQPIFKQRPCRYPWLIPCDRLNWKCILPIR